jgi:hypothetical protein
MMGAVYPAIPPLSAALRRQCTATGTPERSGHCRDDRVETADKTPGFYGGSTYSACEDARLRRASASPTRPMPNNASDVGSGTLVTRKTVSIVEMLP